MLDPRLDFLRVSVTYQAIVHEERDEATLHLLKQLVRRSVLGAGYENFGPMDPQTAAEFYAIDDFDTLCELNRSMSGANGWRELLDSHSHEFPTPSD